MALLMLTRTLATELGKDGIAINYLQVNGAKLSRETIRKFNLPYRILGRLQSLFLKPPEFMADRYFQITTAPEFRGVTGCSINHHLKIMRPVPSETPAGIKTLMGADYYPAIAEDPEAQAKVLEICRDSHEVAVLLGAVDGHD